MGLYTVGRYTVGRYEWWEYDYITFLITASSKILLSHSLNTNACAMKALKTCIMLCLHFARAVLPAIAAHQTTSLVHSTPPNRNNTTESVPKKVLVLPYGKTKFPQGFSGAL